MFQFQCGAIKGMKKIKTERNVISGFNSNVVRLKADTGDLVNRTAQFQFQCGAIKGAIMMTSRCTKFIVSIPMWCD